MEDEATLSTLMGVWLRTQGYNNVTLVESSEEAIEELEHGSFDIAILDIVLPNLDGFQLLEYIRAAFDKSTLPVIMLTSRENPDDIIQAFRLGANDYATKPVDFTTLKKRMEAHLTQMDLEGKTVSMGHFDIQEKLGSGGMGVVYAAMLEEGEERVALKVLHRSLTYDDENVSRFMREVRLAARIDHPNVVKMIDSGRIDEAYYLAMELVEGRNLYDIVCEGPMSIDHTLEVSGQIAEGLAALHEAGIIHRDVKPENILVTNDWRVKITDFGIARDAQHDSRLTAPGIGIGSLAYISPEQMVGDGDHRADIYALGATMYFMLLGKDSVDTNLKAELILGKKLKGAPTITSERADVPRPLSDLIAKMMHPKEELRPQAYDEIKAALHLLQDPSAAGATALLQRISVKQLTLVVVGALAAAGLLALLWSAWS